MTIQNPNLALLKSASGKGRLVLRYTGRSMSPYFKEGDSITFAKQQEYNVGEVVLFSDRLCLVMHRIISKSKGRYITKGDNSWQPDSEIKANVIIGAAKSRNRKKLRYNAIHNASQSVEMLILGLYKNQDNFINKSLCIFFSRLRWLKGAILRQIE